jgi:predicted permease
MWQDVKFGLKLLWTQKTFSLAALLTLALCIGANTAIFTVLDKVVLRGLPFPEPERLVTMYNIYPGVGVADRGSNGVPDYLDRRKLTEVFSEVALIGDNGYDVGLEGSPQRVRGQYVTPSFFRTLGIQPTLGRVFTEEEAVLGKEHVAILSEGLWTQMFSADRGVLGKDIRLSGVPYRIVGVMPDQFGLDSDPPRLWVPFAFRPNQTSDEARHSNNWGMIGRLQPGATVALAQRRIDALNKENLDRFPKYRELLINARFGTRVVGLKDELVRDIRPTLYLLQIAVGAVLLIGCVNLANLMLVRSNIRLKELAIRFSLGAGRWRIARQLITESVTLAVLGGAFGVAVAYAGVRLLTWLGARELPRATTIAIDGSVLAFTALIAVVTGLVFGTVPLASVLRRDLNSVVRDSSRTGTAGRHTLSLRSALVACQVSLAFVLLIGAGLLTLSFSRLLNVKPGFQPEKVLSAEFSLPRVRYKDDAPARNFISGLMERLRAIPGVEHAGATTYLPFSGNNNSSVISIDGRPLAPGENPPVPGWNTIDSGYLAAMNIPLLQGRNFSESDGPDAPKVVIIDQFLARKYWPNGDAVGARLHRGFETTDTLCTIVGVVGQVKTGDLAEKNPVGQIYFPYKQFTPRGMHVVMRSRQGSGAELVNAARRELRSADAELPLFDVKTMPERVTGSLLSRRAAMILCATFSGLALLLAAVGVYGVLSYSVTQRTREFGIRSALGATVGDILKMVLGHGLRLAGVGLVLGIVAALMLVRFMTSLLFEVKPADPAVYLSGIAVLGAVALLAALIPSLRAVRVRPAVALRHE